MFEEYGRAKKKLIDNYLLKFLEKEKPGLKKVNFWGEDFIEKFKKFVVAGKSIRGILVFLSAEMLGFCNEKEILPIAAAFEIIQSSLLIHDDIMDRDLKRRGMETLFASYLPQAIKEKFNDCFHFAISMGINAGDIGFFLAFKLLQSKKINALVVDEIINVSLAQMSDVYWGHKKEMPSLKEIENIYLYKTARYSFSLPLIAGATLAGQPKKILNQLKKLGQFMGIAFQIKNDIKQTGKSTESDIKENKKTLLRFYNYDKNRIKYKLDLLAKNSKKIINKLPVKKKYKDLLLNLISKYLLL